MRRILRFFCKTPSPQRGFSLIETMIAVSIAGIVAFAGITVFEGFAASKSRSKSLNALARFRYALMSSVKSSDSLLKTGQFDCMINKAACLSPPAAGYTQFSALDPDLTKLTKTDVEDAAYGFTRDAKPCSTFPSKTCPFRYVTEWRAICTPTIPGSCLTPQYKIRARLNVAPDAGLALQISNGGAALGRYDFEMTVGQVIGTYEQSCRSIGGTYVPGVTPQCLPSLAGACPVSNPPKYMVGWNAASKTPVCAGLWDTVFCGPPPPPVPAMVIVGTDGLGCPVFKTVVVVPPPTSPQMTSCPGGVSPPCPFFCQVNPTDPSCPQSVPADAPPGGGDGGCGAGGAC